MLNTKISTHFIAKNFAKAHTTYGKSAIAQHQICQRLICLIQTHLPDFFPKSVLEIGCGVGSLTHLYQQTWQIQHLYLNDLYDVNLGIEHAKLLIGDIETLDLPTTQMVISSSALQWIKDLPTLCERIYHTLPCGGVFAFTTFGQQNLYQIKALTGKGLEYHAFDDIRQILHKTGFKIIHAQNTPHTIHFDNPKDILRHIKATGVSVGDMTWTKSSLGQFYQAYQDSFAKFDNTWRYPLTYDAIYIIAIKA